MVFDQHADALAETRFECSDAWEITKRTDLSANVAIGNLQTSADNQLILYLD
jgi:hypothetical protein